MEISNKSNNKKVNIRGSCIVINNNLYYSGNKKEEDIISSDKKEQDYKINLYCKPIYVGKSGKIYIHSGLDNQKRYLDDKCLNPKNGIASKNFLERLTEIRKNMNIPEKKSELLLTKKLLLKKHKKTKKKLILKPKDDKIKEKKLCLDKNFNRVLKRCPKKTNCDWITRHCEPIGIVNPLLLNSPNTKASLKKESKNDNSLGLVSKSKENKTLTVKDDTYTLLSESKPILKFDGDICLSLKKIGKKIRGEEDYIKQFGEEGKVWRTYGILNLHDAVPYIKQKDTNNSMNIIKVNPTNPIDDLKKKLNIYIYDDEIKFGSKIGEGTYGDIYSSKYGISNCIVKIPKDSIIRDNLDNRTGADNEIIKEVYGENIIQSELFCGMRKIGYKNNSARIPKPYFLSKILTDTKSQQSIPIFGMEPLDGNFYELISEYYSKYREYENDPSKEALEISKIFTNIFLNMLESICLLLIDLQKNFKFYHRDMHAMNIMFKRGTKLHDFKWFLIDFGMSTMIVGSPDKDNKNAQDIRINNEEVGVYNGYYDNPNRGREEHDLRLLILMIFDLKDLQLNKLLSPKLYKLLDFTYQDVMNDLDVTENDNYDGFHKGYAYAFENIKTPIFKPNNFLETIVKDKTLREF